jgi:L-fuculose-phosphate aldolase
MLLAEQRAAIARTCRELAATGLVVGTSGNVSVREGDLVAVTPTGVAYEELTPEQVGVHRLDGNAVEAPLKPTSELPLHLAIYAARPGAGAIVHTHSVAATATSTLTDELPAIHYYVAMFGASIRVSPYATYGTDELARNVVGALEGRTGCLMGNHGAVTTGEDLATAHERAKYLEWLCDVYLRATAAGRPRVLPPEEIDRVAAKLATYGQNPDQPRLSGTDNGDSPAPGDSTVSDETGSGGTGVSGGAGGAGSSRLMRSSRAFPSDRGDRAGSGSQPGGDRRASWHRIPAWPTRITSRFSGRYFSGGTPASSAQNRAQCSALSAGVMNERQVLRAASTRSSTARPSADGAPPRMRGRRRTQVPEPDPHRSVTNQRPSNSWNSTMTLEPEEADEPARRWDIDPIMSQRR